MTENLPVTATAQKLLVAFLNSERATIMDRARRSALREGKTIIDSDDIVAFLPNRNEVRDARLEQEAKDHQRALRQTNDSTIVSILGAVFAIIGVLFALVFQFQGSLTPPTIVSLTTAATGSAVFLANILWFRSRRASEIIHAEYLNADEANNLLFGEFLSEWSELELAVQLAYESHFPDRSESKPTIRGKIQALADANVLESGDVGRVLSLLRIRNSIVHEGLKALSNPAVLRRAMVQIEELRGKILQNL